MLQLVVGNERFIDKNGESVHCSAAEVEVWCGCGVDDKFQIIILIFDFCSLLVPGQARYG